MLKDSIDARSERARELRAKGWKFKDIAAELGVSKPTAYRWATPGNVERDRLRSKAWKERNAEQKRAYDLKYLREHRGTCTDCGDQMGIGVSEDGICKRCRRATRDQRCEVIERMWNEGATMSTIAEAVDWPMQAMRAEFGRMRNEGWNLPHRRTPEQRARMKAARWPERIAA